MSLFLLYLWLLVANKVEFIAMRNNDLEGIPLPDFVYSELEATARKLGRAAVLGEFHRNNGNEDKSAVWYADARGYSARAQQITSAFPDEGRRQYRRYVSEVVDTYGMHI